jgi:hypothetical protein
VEFKIPHISDELIEYLGKLYPERSPEPEQSDRVIWINRGAVGVVRHLTAIHQQQRENMLGNSNVHEYT